MKFLSIEDMVALGNKSSNDSFKSNEVDLKVTDEKPTTTKIIRLIGFPVPVQRFSPYKKSESGKRVEHPFPDAVGNTSGYKENRKYYRVGTQDDPEYGECPWTRGHWERSQRMAQNCLERHKDGTFSVSVLTASKMLFDEFTKLQKMNQQRNEESGKKKYPINFGTEVSYDFRIVVEQEIKGQGPKKIKMPKYTVSPEPDSVTITEEEIEALEAVGKPSAEEIEAIYEANPFLRKFPEWVLYGHNLKRQFRPDLLQKETDDDDETPPAKKTRATVSADEDDEPPVAKKKVVAKEEDWEEETPPVKAPKAKAPVAAEEEEEPESVFEDEEDLGF